MFYTYGQNNSRGSFDFDKNGITHFVIVEANSPREADAKAENIGLYFDGYGDCPCCGDRWHGASSYDESDVPKIYDQEVGEDKPYVSSTLWMGDNPEAVIHYADGRVVWVKGEKISYAEERKRRGR